MRSTTSNITVGWTINCSRGIWSGQHSDKCYNWWGYDPTWKKIGSINTTFVGNGLATLNFGNCYTDGYVEVYVDGTLKANATKNQRYVQIDFPFHDDSVLEIREHGAIIQFNNLNIIYCGKHFLQH